MCDKNEKTKVIRLKIVDELLSTRYVSHLDMCIALDKAEGLTSITRDETMSDMDYYSLLMDQYESGSQRNHLNGTIRQIVDIWALVRRGIDLDRILKNSKISNKPSRDDYKQLLIEAVALTPNSDDKKLDLYNTSEATRLYLRNSTQSLYLYRYIDKKYSIFKKMEGAKKSDWELYVDSLEVSRIQSKITPGIYYDNSEANKYDIIPEPDVIKRRVRLLMIKALQDELLRDTTGAVKRRLEDIDRLKKLKPKGWMYDTSNTYLNAILDGRGIINDLDLSPIIHHYGSFLMDQKEYVKGHSFLMDSLETIRDTMLAGNEKAREEYALILQNLAALHSYTGNYALAEDEALQALGIFRKLSKENKAYSYGVAILLNSLASIHVRMRKYDTVEEEYDEAVQLFSRLSDEKPTEYLYMLVECITELANYYYSVKKLNESTEAYERAMPFLEKLTEKNFDDFAPQKLNAMINYALALQESGAIQKAEDILYESIHLTHILNERNPNVYNEELSTALQNLGALFGETGNTVKARELLLNAEKLRRELVTTDPRAYNSRLAVTLDSLANLDFYEGNSNEAISKWNEALLLLNIYDNDESYSYHSLKGQYCFYIGLTYQNLRDKNNAMLYLDKAESLFRSVFDRKSSPQMFEDKYAMTLSYLGVLYESIEEKENEAERKFEESLDIALWLNSCANLIDHSFLIIVYCNYAPYLFNKGQYEEAKQMWEYAVKIGEKEEVTHLFLSQFQDLLDLAKQNIIEAEYRIEHPEDVDSEEDKTFYSYDSTSFTPEEALEAVKKIEVQIESLNKDDVAYREKCINLYKDSLPYCSSIADSFFLADYLSTLCKFITDSYIFKPVIKVAPVALGTYENALKEDNSNMQIRLKYIELLSVYCRSLDEYNLYDELYKAIGTAFELLKPIEIDRQDDIACTYAALKGEIILDFIADNESEDTYSLCIDVLNYYRNVAHPHKDCMCRLLTKAAIIACENEKYYEAEQLISEAEETMKDCDLNNLDNRLRVGELYTFKGRYIDKTPLKWPNNYKEYSVDRALEAFSYAQLVLEGGVIYNHAAFECKLLELFRFKLLCVKIYIPVLHSNDVTETSNRMLKLMENLTHINEYVFSWRAVDAYLEVAEALNDLYFALFYDGYDSKEKLEEQYNRAMSMFTHMESMLAIYKKTAPDLFKNYIAKIADERKQFKKDYRSAME